MKKITCFYLCLFVFQLNALQPEAKAPLYQHLLELNRNWKLIPTEKFSKETSFKSDMARIQTHLFSVIELMRGEKHHFSQEQLRWRNKLLDELALYAENGIFPVNRYHSERRPYFIDHLGTHCAVAYLMLQSGSENLAQQIKHSENYAYIHEIRTAGVAEWAERHGFTLDELSLIQPTYSIPSDYQNIQGTTNGPVTRLTPHYSQAQSSLIFSGDFTEINGLPCLHIGRYQENQLSCLAGGLNGEVIDVKHNFNELYVAGNLESDGLFYPLAHLNGDHWEYFSLPHSDTYKVVSFNVFQLLFSDPSLHVQLVIKPENSSRYEIWTMDVDGAWSKQAETNGIVNDIESSYSKVVYAGKFDSVFIYQNGSLTTHFQTNNIISHDRDFVFDNSIQGPVSDSILTILAKEDNDMYFGGTFRVENAGSVAIAHYLNGVVQPLVTGGAFINTGSLSPCFVTNIGFESFNQQLYFSGNFMAGWMDMGSNFARYNFAENTVYAANNFNGTVHDFEFFEDDRYFAGEFNHTDSNGVTGYLVRQNGTNSLPELSMKMQAYPNPAAEKIQLEGFEPGALYEIRDINGKLLLSGKLSTEGIDISQLETAVYFLKTGAETHRFVKN